MTHEDFWLLLQTHGSVDVGHGVSELAISEAELELGTPILGEYRQFLRRYGWGAFGSLEVFGLGTNVPRRFDLIHVTQRERALAYPPMRTCLLPIMADGAGNHYCLDTTTEGPAVVFWDHEQPPDQIPSVEAPDFSTWLAAMIEDLKQQ